MDDQMTAAPATPAAVTESQPDIQPNVQFETPSEFSDYDAPPMPNGDDSEISIDEDGEVKFSEEFFGEMPEYAPDLEKPRYYTQDELRNTPFERWEKDRVPEELREYYDIVSSQLQSRHAQRQIEQRPSTPPIMEAPRNYTPKELAEEAQRLAIQRLGLEDADDFDDYEPEHRAALNMAMNDLMQQNNAARQNYARVTQEYQNLQQFNAQLASLPDYREFDRWFDGKLKEYKTTPQVLDAYLTNFIKQSGGNYGAIQQMIAAWYNEYKQETGKHKAPQPPMMESPTGQPYETIRGVDMKDFGNMSADAQAAALMRMGYV